MKFGYLGEDKLDVKGEWRDKEYLNLRTDLGKFVIGKYNYSGTLNNHIVGRLETREISNDIKLFVTNLYCYSYKVISKEVYEALTT